MKNFHQELINQEYNEEIKNKLKTISNEIFENEEIKKYSDVTYISFKEFGFQIMIKNFDKKIDSLFFYNENKKLGFKKYPGELPFEIKFTEFNSDIVNRFGEPSKKGGNNIPVWIEYENKDDYVNLVIDFVNKSFDDDKNPISFITIYKI
jgi:hypothetical protein